MYVLRYKRKKDPHPIRVHGLHGEKAPHYLPHGRSCERRAGLMAIAPQAARRPRGRPRKLRVAQVSLHSLGFHYPPQDCGPLNSVLAPLPPAWGCSNGTRPRALSPLDTILYWELPGFQGFFDDLFVPEDLALWNRWETEIGMQNLPREVPPLRDMFIYECVRVNMGCETYAQFQRALGMLGPAPVLPLLATPTFVPTEQDFSDFYRVTPLDAFQELFWNLVERLYETKAIRCRIMIWDCQFVHSNASDYKDHATGTYSDRDAWVGRHQGKFLGVGYMVSTLYLYCGDVVAPVFCVVFPANTSDKQIFAETMRYYYTEGSPMPLVILCDRGAYSIANLRYYPAMAPWDSSTRLKPSRNSAWQSSTATTESTGDLCQWSGPTTMSSSSMNLRTAIERRFSPNNLVHHARRSNVREIAEVAKHRYLLLILEVLKILACVSLGRGDLLRYPTAFSRLRSTMTIQEIGQLLAKAGYTPFSPLTPRISDINKIRMIMEWARGNLNENPKS